MTSNIVVYPWYPGGFTGDGDPEGVIEAVQGSIYRNNLGVLNEAVFMKVTGTGTAGWSRIVVIDRASGRIYIGQNVPDHGSNAGIQYATTTANRAQFRGNQYGANASGPGVTGFKSRGPIGGPDVGVVDGDLLFRVTAIGTAQNLSIPLAATLSLQVPLGGSLAVPGNYVASEMELQLVPLEGPVNGATVQFKITSQGVPMLRETAARPAPLPALAGVTAGLAATGALGTIFVPNVNVRAAAPGTTGTRVALTIQPGGAAPTGAVWVSAITPGSGFTIQSMTGDVGVQVYWQLWEGV